ncbi:Acylphosphatase-like domain-containing protein [Bombardia bombarda]|uniref:acylphosphatase n=1 Tax=Bombardia bombarda TaxID=252184 RepID=A0AA40C8G3_9PEZI|nr:Acylphosphatase-like domain-containing protein [Bombardia bombarda]
MADKVKRVYFLAHGGVVQGVSFRYFTQKRATSHNLTGWVRNRDDNKVEGEAQGKESALTLFLKDVDKGPKIAHVVRLDKEDRDVVEGEEGFVIRR